MLTQVEEMVFDKEEFLKGLGNLKQDTLQRLEVCIQTEQDAKRYMEMVEKEELKWKGQTAKSFAAMALREEQIKNHPVTFEEFKATYSKDPVKALQMLFWQKITQDDVDKLMPKWFAEKTLKNIYDKHVKSPYDNFSSIVL